MVSIFASKRFSWIYILFVKAFFLVPRMMMGSILFVKAFFKASLSCVVCLVEGFIPYPCCQACFKQKNGMLKGMLSGFLSFLWVPALMDRDPFLTESYPFYRRICWRNGIDLCVEAISWIYIFFVQFCFLRCLEWWWDRYPSHVSHQSEN